MFKTLSNFYEFNPKKPHLVFEQLWHVERLVNEIGAYVAQRNERQAKVIWGFFTPDARKKMGRLYPK